MKRRRLFQWLVGSVIAPRLFGFQKAEAEPRTPPGSKTKESARSVSASDPGAQFLDGRQIRARSPVHLIPSE